MSKKPLGALGLLKVAREVRKGAGGDRPIAVGGARELVPLLAKELRAGGDPAAVIEGPAGKGAAALVWIGPAAKEQLRAASAARVPIVGVTEGESLPYVLDTDLVRLSPARGLPVEAIAGMLARVLGAGGVGLAARLPVLREAVVDELIAAAARKNGLVGAAVFVPGVDMPILTLNQLRLVLRIALAYGHEIDQSRVGEVAAVVGAGYGFRAVARELLDLVPVAGWALKGAVAYGGTKAVGEAARRRFAA
jgi:uncharacterized protein (DUF697 family)